MANQLRSEETQESTYSLPAAGRTEVRPAEEVEVCSAETLDIWLANAKQKIDRNKLRSVGITVGMGICAFAPAVLGGMLSHTALEYLFGVDVLVLGLLFGLGFKTLSRKPVWTAAELEQIGGVRAVGALIDLASIPGAGRDLDAMQRALTRLLLQMKEDDASLLNTEQRSHLYRLLDNSAQPRSMTATHEAYVVSIIKACAHIGDAEALQRISQIVSGQAVTRSQQAIKAAAEECLPRLQARVALLSANTTLLRGSSREYSSPETLLHPAAGPSNTDSNQLLVGSDLPEHRVDRSDWEE